MTTSRRKAPQATPKRLSYRHAFVDNMPDKLDDGVLYVCLQYATSAHNCFCGCQREVVTPIHPTKWKLTFDGVNISLFPSIGSWSLPCRSHYWLQDGKVAWAECWSETEIQAVRSRDTAVQDRYFGTADLAPPTADIETPKPLSPWHKISNWLKGS
jgi:hypothetical protein